MTQQHLGCLEDTGRVRVIRQPLLYHTRRGAMNSFKHRVMVADIGAACRTDAALNLRCFVSDDVAVQIRQDKYLKLASDGRIDQIRGHDVDIPVLRGDSRIIRGNLMADPRKIAIGLFHNIGFGHDRHIVLAVCLGVFKGCASDASGARLGGYLKIHGKHARNFHTAAAQDVFSLSVFPIEHPVDPLCRNRNRSDIGI